MNIKVNYNGGDALLLMSGVIDIQSAEELKKTLREVAGNEAKNVVLDFSEVDSIGSSGIGALIITHKEYNSTGVNLAVKNLNKEIRTLFEIIKLDKLISIQE